MERNVEKRNTNISISAEVMNSTNKSKQLSTQEACNTEIGTWGSQVSGSQCHANYQKTKQRIQTNKTNKNPQTTKPKTNKIPTPQQTRSTA